MITIRPHGTMYNGFDVIGHAGYAEHGQDIVCASVSFATQMVASELEFQNTGRFTMKDGLLRVSIVNIRESSVYINMLKRSLHALQEQYPNHITIEEEF